MLMTAPCTTRCHAHTARDFLADVGVEGYRRQKGISNGTPARNPGDKHAGQWEQVLASDPEWFAGSLGRTSVDKVVTLAQAERDEGRLFKDLVNDEHRRDEYSHRVVALMDAIHGGDANITAAYADAQRAREKYLTPEALAALTAEREAKARDEALPQHAEYLEALTNLIKHPGPGDDVPDDRALAIEEARFRVSMRVLDALVKEPCSARTYVSLRVIGQRLIDGTAGSPTAQGNGSGPSSPNGGGTLPPLLVAREAS